MKSYLLILSLKHSLGTCKESAVSSYAFGAVIQTSSPIFYNHEAGMLVNLITDFSSATCCIGHSYKIACNLKRIHPILTKENFLYNMTYLFSNVKLHLTARLRGSGWIGFLLFGCFGVIPIGMVHVAFGGGCPSARGSPPLHYLAPVFRCVLPNTRRYYCLTSDVRQTFTFSLLSFCPNEL